MHAPKGGSLKEFCQELQQNISCAIHVAIDMTLACRALEDLVAAKRVVEVSASCARLARVLLCAQVDGAPRILTLLMQQMHTKPIMAPCQHRPCRFRLDASLAP